MKKIISVVLAVIMVAGLCTSMPAASAAVVKENYFVTSAKAEKSVQSLQKKVLETGKISDDLITKDEFEESIKHFEAMISEVSFYITEESLETITMYLNEAKAVLQKEGATAQEMYFSIINLSMSFKIDKDINSIYHYLNMLILNIKDIIVSLEESPADAEAVKALEALLDDAFALRDKADLTFDDVEAFARRIGDVYRSVTLFIRESLIEIIESAAHYVNSGKYTEEELADLKKVIKNAQLIIDNENSTAQEIRDAYNAIDYAISVLSSNKTTKEELQALIDEAKKYLNEGLYYPEELEILKQYVDEAEQVIANSEASDIEITSAYVGISKSIKYLPVLDDEYSVEAIEQLIDEAMEYINSRKLNEDEIKSELEFAKSVIAKEEPLQKELRKAYNDLDNTIRSILKSNKNILRNILIYVENTYIDENSELYQLFTQESLDALLEVYDASKAVLEDVNSIDGSYSSAYDKLMKAIELLKVGKFDREALLYQIIRSSEIVINASVFYAPDSAYETMRSSIIDAEAVYLDETSTDKAVEDAVKLLNSCYDLFQSHKNPLYGDYNMDGKVNIRDATSIQMVILEYRDVADFDLTAGDVDGNEVINIRDATCIQKWILGYIEFFPAEFPYYT